MSSSDGYLDFMDQMEAPDLPGAGPVWSGSGYTTLSQRQTGLVYDLLSEGPIEGLVNEAEGIQLDGVPLRDKDTNLAFKEIATTGTIESGSLNTITVPATVLEKIDSDTLTLRTVQVMGAGTSPTAYSPEVTFTIEANSTRLTSDGIGFFTRTMAGFESGSPDRQLGWENQTPIEIPGAGPNGSSLFANITSFDGSGVVHLDTKAIIGVSSITGVKLGHKAKIASINTTNNTITLETAAATAVTDASVFINPPTITQDPSRTKYNFANVSYSFRTGTANQPPMPQKGDINTNASYLHPVQLPLKQNLKYGGKASDTVISDSTMGIPNASEIDRLKVTFDMPSGLRIMDEGSGDEHSSYFEFEILFEYSNDDGVSYNVAKLAGRDTYDPVQLYKSGASGPGSGFRVPNNHNEGIISGNYDKRRLKELTFQIEQYQPFTDWRLRIRKVSAEDAEGLEDKFKHIGSLTLQSIEGLVEDSLMYPLSAYAAVTYGAEDFPRPPRRSYHLRGLKIQVPTNYITREEAGSLQAKYTRNVNNGTDENKEQDWNGAFRGDISNFAGGSVNGSLVYCNNPAWVFYDLCTNARYGLGKIIEPSLVDKYSLYSIARYCDELVPDGKGGQEPRFTCNVYITRQVEAYKLLKDLATVFRGLTYWMDGQIIPIQDSPKEPVYTFTQGNVINGSFDYETTSDRIQKNQIRVTWNDPQANFSQRVELVEDHDDIVEKNRFVPHDVAAFGCTSKGQARRVGLWHLVTSRQETEVVSFQTGEAGHFIRPGDVIFVQDHERESIEFSGRISLESPVATTTAFAIDREITLSSSNDYEVFVFFSEAAAILNQDSATINSVTYSRGDVVTTGITAGSPGGTITIDSEEIASSIIDDSGNAVTLQWAGEGHLEKRDISNSGTVSHITVSSAFSFAPEEETIYAIRNKAGGSQEPKQYKVVALQEEDDSGNVSVVAAFFFDRKFDAIDFGYATSLTPSEDVPTRLETLIPKPTDVSLMYGQSTFNYGVRDDSTEGRNLQTSVDRTTRAVLSWGEPEQVIPTETVYAQVGSPHVEAITHLSTTLSELDTIMYVNDASYFSADGGYVRIGSGDNREWIKFTGIDLGSPNALTGLTRGVNGTSAKVYEASQSPSVIQYVTASRKYNKLSGYDVEVYGGSYDTPIKRRLNSDATRFILPGIVTPAAYTIKIRTRSIEGNVSDFVTITRSLELSVTDAGDRLHQLPRGGYCSTTMKINVATGLLTFHHPNFVFQSVTGNIYEYENVSEVSETIDFGGLTGGTIAFLAHHPQDESPEKFTNDFIPVEEQRHNDWRFSDAEVSPEITSNAVWLKQVGQSGSPDTFGLVQASGTITTVRGSSEVSGTSTAFTTEFKVGDLIRFDTSSTIALNSTAFYGRIANIVNDSTLILENSIDRLFVNDFVFRQSFRPDFVEDSLVTRVVKDDAGAFTLLPFSGTIVGPNAVQSAEIAANAIGSTAIQTGIVDASILADGTVDSDLLAANAVTNIHISANSIEQANISAGAIENVNIAANAIESVNITSGSIESVDIAANAIENVNVAANAINTANIIAGSIDTVNIAANAIGTAQIESGSIDTVNIAANAIESANITSGAIDTVNIAANAITFQEIEAGSIQSVNIAANAIGIQQIAANSIDAVKIAANAIGIQEIAADSIDSVKISANAIAQTNIQADAISNVELSTNAVINANIASDSIESANMSAGSVINAAIAVNSIENQNISAQSVNAIVIAPNALENFHVSVNAITGSNIAENSIEQALIAANAIGTAQIAANSIGAAAILANSIGVASIQANSIGTQQIISGSISNLDIAANAVESANIKANNITTAKIASNNITTASIAANNVTTTSIAANNVTTASIAANNVTTASIAANNVLTATIKSDQIETAHIKANNITTAKIAANNITTALIAADNVTTASIAANNVTTASIAGGNITTALIDGEAITTAKIDGGAITTAKISANNITTALIASNNVTTASIAGSNVTTALIAANNVTTAKIASNNITTASIAANNVTTASIASGNITSALIDGGAITTAKIAANNITTATIAAGNIDTLQINTSAVSTVKVAQDAITESGLFEHVSGTADITSEGSYNVLAEGALTSTGNATINAIAFATVTHFGDAGIETNGLVTYSYRLQRKIGSGSYATISGVTNALIQGKQAISIVTADSSTANSSGTVYTYQWSVNFVSHNGYVSTLRVLEPTLRLELLKK